MQAQAWSIPFPRKNRSGKKQKRGSRKPAAAPAVPRQQRALPPWNSSTTDLHKHKLTAEELVSRFRCLQHACHERGKCSACKGRSTHAVDPAILQAFRKSLRQSRHRQQSWAAHSQQQMDAAAAAGEATVGLAEEVWAGGCEGWQLKLCGASREEMGAAGAANAAAPDSDSDAGGSLVDMQAFVAELQCRYGLAGIPPAPVSAPTAAQRRLAELRAAAAAAAALDGEEASSDSGTDTEGCRRSVQRLQSALRHQHGTAAAAAGRPAALARKPPAESTSDSEGEGHLGPAAARRARQRQVAAAAAGIAAALGADSDAGPCCPQHRATTAWQRPSKAEEQLEARLEAAEGRLAGLAGVEAELHETRAEVAQLREQNAQLQTGKLQLRGCMVCGWWREPLDGALSHAQPPAQRCSPEWPARAHVPLPAQPPAELSPPVVTSLLTSPLPAADLNEFVSHTSTLLTSLQTQLSGFLAAGAAPASAAVAAAPHHSQEGSPWRPTAAAAAGAAILQARAAAEALSIAQQAQARAACGGACASEDKEAVGPPTAASAQPPARSSSHQAAQEDVLASLQLPAFQGLAQLQPAAAQAARAAAPVLKPRAGPPLPRTAAGNAAVSCWERHVEEENSPPRQRDAARLPVPTPTRSGMSSQS